MSKLLLTVLLTVGIILVTLPAMAKHGADDPAGHEHGSGATGGGQVHVEHERHGGGTTTGNTTGGSTSGSRHGGRDANEILAHLARNMRQHAAGHDVNDANDVPPAPPAAP